MRSLRKLNSAPRTLYVINKFLKNKKLLSKTPVLDDGFILKFDIPIYLKLVSITVEILATPFTSWPIFYYYYRPGLVLSERNDCVINLYYRGKSRSNNEFHVRIDSVLRNWRTPAVT